MPIEGECATHHPDARAWSRFATTFVDDFDAYTDQIQTRIADELPSFEGVRPSDLHDVVRKGMSGLLPSVTERRPLSPAELALYRHTTEVQAAQGVPLDEMLQAWHIGFDVLSRWARDRIPDEATRSDVLLEFLDLIVPWVDKGVAISASCYRAAARHSLQTDDRERTTFVRRVLLGNAAPADLLVGSRSYGLRPNRAFHALRAPAHDESALSKVSAWLGLRDGAGEAHGVVAVVDGNIWGFVEHLPEEPIDIPIGVSAATPVDELATAFGLATRAMDTAAALDLSGCHDLRSLGVHLAVLEHHDVGTGLIDRYITPLEELGDAGIEILNTVYAFLDHQGRYERAGAELFIHPNTVRYRIRRFEEITGACLRETASIVAVWWALERRRLLSPAR